MFTHRSRDAASMRGSLVAQTPKVTTLGSAFLLAGSFLALTIIRLLCMSSLCPASDLPKQARNNNTTSSALTTAWKPVAAFCKKTNSCDGRQLIAHGACTSSENRPRDTGLQFDHRGDARQHMSLLSLGLHDGGFMRGAKISFSRGNLVVPGRATST
jgi:hypothetical protein